MESDSEITDWLSIGGLTPRGPTPFSLLTMPAADALP